MRTAIPLLLVLLAAGARADGVKNPGFEELSADGKAPAAWALPAKPGVRFSLDDTVSHSGKRSARVEGTDPEKQDHYVQAWRQDVAPLPEGDLWVSAWVKAEGISGGRVNVLLKDAKGEVLRNQFIEDFAGTFDWREVAGPVRRPPGVVSLQLVMGLIRSKGSVWFDDIVVASLDDAARDPGSATMTPAQPLPAGSTSPVTFEVTLGRRGLAEGGSIRLQWQNWRTAREYRLQDLRAACEGTTARFEVSVPPRKTSWPPEPTPVACIATLKEGGPLPAGAKARITATLAASRFTNVSCPLQVLLAPAAGAASRPVGQPFIVAAKAGPAALIRCIAEARPAVGKPGRVTVAVTDAHGNPATDFRGRVRLSCNTDAGLPAEYAFTEADGGSHDFAGRFPAGVVSRVIATSGEMAATSNPILPRGEGEPGVYFGDIHSHCAISADAVGEPDAAYDYARRFWCLDFAALTDHSPRGEAWRADVAATNRANQAGRFVTFLGFEWSDGVHGHRNAYYRDDDGPENPKLEDNMRSWWALLKEQGIRALTVPHHPNTDSGVKLADGRLVWGPVDWSETNDTYQRVVEICQSRGSFEVPGGPDPELRVAAKDRGASVQTALAKGYHLGFIGSTDTHSGRPGTGPARCVIVSGDFSRTGLWDALYARSCYATTGAHLLVSFVLNGRPMGSELKLEGPTPKREITWRVVGTGPLKRVDLLRSNTVVRSWTGEGKDDLSGDLVFAEPLAGVEWWYLRAIQEDAEMAWSSPTWVEPAGTR